MIEKHPCLHCGEQTEVNRIFPLPPNEEKKSGLWVSWIDENQTEHTIGVICEKCGYKHYHLAFDGHSLEAFVCGLNEVKRPNNFLPEFKRWLEKRA